ncbi:MAG: 2-amino-4-hydroxy-6-hydroxymethyldihydropteridine diphosphokinase [Gammaproteobacteria bacterium]|nr:2-amino-4-hydroxy-6-hydroxymethyldihydropteridine diphosphokinase [Gammaproteobacteria bacterium]
MKSTATYEAAPSVVRAYIGLGSNLNDPVSQIHSAIAALRLLPGSQLASVSRLYQSAPMGPQDQPDYINAAVCLDTHLGADRLLLALQVIEHQQGRVRDNTRWQARTLDLDLLLYGEEEIACPSLTVPHSGISQRLFVLQPLWDLNPDLVVPGQGALATLLANLACDSMAVRPISDNDAPCFSH